MSNNQHRKLIFFDIDGTLITEGPNHRVPESTLKALELLRRNGHICLINTGRVYAALDQLILSIPVDGYVCGCGTNIRLGDQILTSNRLPPELCRRIVHALEDEGMDWLLEGEEMIYFADRQYTTGLGKTVRSLEARYLDTIRRITADDYDHVQFSKFIMFVPEGKSHKGIQQAFEDELTFIDRGNDMYEVIPKAFSKATGMQYMEEYFGISHEDTIAVGDSTNDISMLEYAGTGILMGGSDPSLLRYADYVTAPIEEDGIFQAFRHLGLI